LKYVDKKMLKARQSFKYIGLWRVRHIEH